MGKFSRKCNIIRYRICRTSGINRISDFPTLERPTRLGKSARQGYSRACLNFGNVGNRLLRIVCFKRYIIGCRSGNLLKFSRKFNIRCYLVCAAAGIDLFIVPDFPTLEYMIILGKTHGQSDVAVFCGIVNIAYRFFGFACIKRYLIGFGCFKYSFKFNRICYRVSASGCINRFRRSVLNSPALERCVLLGKSARQSNLGTLFNRALRYGLIRIGRRKRYGYGIGCRDCRKLSRKLNFSRYLICASRCVNLCIAVNSPAVKGISRLCKSARQSNISILDNA